MGVFINVLLGLVPAAHGFCGAYVGSADDGALENQASQVILSRVDDSRTTLTLVNDLRGTATDFALLVPVPPMDESDVKVIEPEPITTLNTYTAPRLVSYTCEDFVGPQVVHPMSCGLGCSSFETIEAEPLNARGGSVSTVEVEAEFSRGEYELALLTAQESSDLLTWLDNNGYQASPELQEMLQEYLDQGVRFLAAKVSLEAQESGVQWLRPLQISYDSKDMILPIRLGTANSPGEQELILTVLSNRGTVSIANYSPTGLPANECMLWKDSSFSEFYGDMLDRAFSNPADEASWLLEYAWGGGKCDPCPPTGPLDRDTAHALGFTPHPSTMSVTRIRMRYRPDQIQGDLSLYHDDLGWNQQVRYIAFNPNVRSIIDTCETGPRLGGPDCFDPVEWDTGVDTGDTGPLLAELEDSEGCSALPGRGGWAALSFLAAIFLLRRRETET